jgi:hypothetical protein
VVDVGDPVDEAHDLPLERRRLTRPGVVEDAVADLFGEVEPASVPLEDVDDAKGLLVVAEAASEQLAQHVIECLLAGVSERRMTEIVPEGNCLGEVLVQPESTRNGS